MLTSIYIERFKGIKELRCNFSDLTLLAGLNNTGKSSVLQAVYLLVSVIPQIVRHGGHAEALLQNRQIALGDSITQLGLPGFEWLLQGSDIRFRLEGTFSNGVTITVEMIGRGACAYTITTPPSPQKPLPDASEKESAVQDQVRSSLAPLEGISAELFRPPGILQPREPMLAGPQYRNLLARGEGGQNWRNSIWWSLQSSGVETFEEVRNLVHRYFTDVDLRLPTLSEADNPPVIVIGYTEPGTSALDIAQSGGGLHTFLSLAQMIKQTTATILLFDEPDTHLHASQQAVVINLLTEITESENRQVILATHAPEMITRVNGDSIRWLVKDNPLAQGGPDVTDLLNALGASPGVHLSPTHFPDIIVYVEGKEDKTVLEGLIEWCRRNSAVTLPSTIVIRHDDGKFNELALQGIFRTVKAFAQQTRVVGIRDLDWDYRDWRYCQLLWMKIFVRRRFP